MSFGSCGPVDDAVSSSIDAGFFALALCIIKGIDANDSLRYLKIMPKYGTSSVLSLDDLRKRVTVEPKPRGNRKVEIVRYLRKHPDRGIRDCAKALRVSSSTIIKVIQEKRRNLVLPLFATSEEMVILKSLREEPTKKIEVIAFELGFPRKLILRTLYDNIE